MNANLEKVAEIYTSLKNLRIKEIKLFLSKKPGTGSASFSVFFPVEDFGDKTLNQVGLKQFAHRYGVVEESCDLATMKLLDGLEKERNVIYKTLDHVLAEEENLVPSKFRQDVVASADVFGTYEGFMQNISLVDYVDDTWFSAIESLMDSVMMLLEIEDFLSTKNILKMLEFFASIKD